MITGNFFPAIAYNATNKNNFVMRGLKWVLMVIAIVVSFTVNAQEKENSLKKAASEKALVYTAKMMKTLNLSKEQAAQVYRLRYELSISLQLIHLQYADNEKLMMQFVADTQKDFQIGIKKLLKPEQIAILNQYKKDFVASQHKASDNKAVETLPQTAAYEW